jgi:IclR family transcriptional regulator, mhp operon transcriptional activator
MDRDETVHSVARAFSVVEILNAQRVTSLEALHRSTGVPKPTLVRLLETLIAAGYVHRVSRREGYAVTEHVLRLSAGVRDRDVLVDVARPLMEAFTLEHKWQISLGTHEGDGLLIRATTRHISPFSRDQLFLNRPVGLLSSVIGRAYFAFCSETEREVILKFVKSSDAADARIAASPERVQTIIDVVRRRRYATGQPIRPGPYRSLAIPVMGARSCDDLLGAMVMFWYGSVMTERQAAGRYLQPLYDLAEQIAHGVESSLKGANDTDPHRIAVARSA